MTADSINPMLSMRTTVGGHFPRFTRVSSRRQFRSVWGGTLLFALLLGGCASYQPRPLIPSREAAALQARDVNAAGLRAFLAAHGQTVTPWPLPTWDLSSLTLLALYDNPQFKVARAQWQRARAGTETAAQLPNPSLHLFQQHHSLAPAGLSPWSYGLALGIPLQSTGLRQARVAQAHALADAADLELAAAAWQIRSTVRVRFVGLDAARRNVDLLKSEVALRKTALRLLQRQYALGAITASTLTMAHIQEERAQSAVLSAQGQVADQRAALAGILGLPLDALAHLRLDFSGIQNPPTGKHLPSPAVQRAALLDRLDIRTALDQYSAAEAGLRLEIAKQYPQFQLGPGYEWDQGDQRWTLGLSLSLPVFNQNQGQIAEAEARRVEVAARFEVLQLHVLTQVERGMAAYQNSVQTWNATNHIVAVQQQEAQQISAQFAAGEIDRLAVIRAQLQTVVAKRDRLTAQVESEHALGRLEDAVQQPLEGGTPLPPVATLGPRQAPHDKQGS
ncbi:TolC family protein [Thiomonas arsenitoxydans]|uniref:TolC family protein n=2 Tax=Thiomonas TaxID=32012 RepID=UPI002D1FB60D|nr:TolC family protein [Thiomonas arsenitoxydans]